MKILKLCLILGLVGFWSGPVVAQEQSPTPVPAPAAVSVSIHADLHVWIERAVKDQAADPLTLDDVAALKAFYTNVHADMISQIEAESAQAALTPPNYLRGDLASVALMKITRSVVVDSTISAEDLWYTFISLKMRRIYQQVMGSDSAHYLTADNIAYKKLLEIRTELKGRGLHLPGVNIIKSMNIVRD